MKCMFSYTKQNNNKIIYVENEKSPKKKRKKEKVVTPSNLSPQEGGDRKRQSNAKGSRHCGS